MLPEERPLHPILAELSQKQMEAVLSDEKRILVLAGAGSGKTKTLIQKIIYLMFVKQIKPRNILAITFTKNAANEMIDRLIFTADDTGNYKKIIFNKKISHAEKEKARYEYMEKHAWIKNITVKTFHSLCYSIMRKHGSPEFDNKFKLLIDKLEDEEIENRHKAKETQDEIIRDLIVKRCENLDYLLKLKRYILDFYVDKIQTIPRSQSQLYDNKIYTTLRGEKVRSKSERYIADWLYMHNIDYVYEPTIALKDFEFNPDFFIPEINTYIEHVSNLSKGTEDKEEQFDLTGHTLFKTYENMTRNINDFYAALERIVFARFEKKISENTALRYEEEFRSYHDKVHIFVHYVISAIDKIKVSNHNFEEICKRATQNPHDRVKIFYELLKPIYDDYQEYCTKKSYLDFNDLLIKAVNLLENNQEIKDHYRELFQYVLVDEFQDVNKVQVQLLNEIIDNKTQLFCVGDDWQSIYGFRGSEVEYIVNFQKYFPTSVIVKLDINYRSNDVIVNASNEVIKNNKFKIDKEIKSANSSGKKIYLYCAKREEEDGVNTVVKKIQQFYDSGYSKEDILFLYRRTDTYRPYFQKFKEIGLKVQARTIHASKGLEAKIVFIIGLKEGPGGFPNVWEDDQIFQIIRKTNYDLLMEEERRLFYVALTRAKDELFLISEQGNESIFVEEIPGEFLDRTNFLILNLKKQEPKLCLNCRKKIQEDYIYCPYCGKYCTIPDSNENIMKKQNFSEEEKKYKILCCLKEIRCNTGRSLLCQVLKGSKSEAIYNTKTYETKYYGALNPFYTDYIMSLIDELIHEGFIEIYKSERAFGHPLIRLTPKSDQFIKDNSKNEENGNSEAKIKISDSQNDIQEKEIETSNKAYLLGLNPTKENIPILIIYLTSDEQNDRRLAASALGKHAGIKPDVYSAVPHLIRLLNDPHPQVRQYSIKALGEIGDKKALEPLRHISQMDKEEYNRQAAIRAIIDLQDETKEKVVDHSNKNQDINPDKRKSDEHIVDKETHIRLMDAFNRRDKKRVDDYKKDG